MSGPAKHDLEAVMAPSQPFIRPNLIHGQSDGAQTEALGTLSEHTRNAHLKRAMDPINVGNEYVRKNKSNETWKKIGTEGWTEMHG